MTRLITPAKQLPLDSGEMAAIAERYVALAVEVSRQIDSNIRRWQQAVSEGVRGAAFNAAAQHEEQMQVPAARSAAQMQQIASVLEAALPFQRQLETLWEGLRATAPFAAAAGAPVLQLHQRMRMFLLATGRGLDALCGAEIARVCSAELPPPTSRLADYAELPARDIDVLQRAQAPQEIQPLLADNADVTVLEASDGRLVVAVGDIDAAESITTVVAGVGSSDISGWGTYLERTRSIASATGGAAVMWMGYSAPSNLGQALSRDSAQRGSEELRTFQQSLRERRRAITAGDSPGEERVAEPRLLTLGHSYGSTVAGMAAREEGLATDALVLLGSPGVGAHHREELVFDNEETDVVALTGSADVITLAPDPHFGVHGPDPSSSSFGAEVWHGRHTHTSYWDDPELLARLGRLAHR
ncbi:MULTISPECIES: alpha/beta hydrolase [Corynebacterium]|uniref:alpha/beta hydrolase n=1 Tax=Corynebacterium TaxID=1716 RepID=UPI00124DF8F4|nr:MULTISPECIES: alpha/beta hydrolase [Corynebacterium]